MTDRYRPDDPRRDYRQDRHRQDSAWTTQRRSSSMDPDRSGSDWDSGDQSPWQTSAPRYDEPYQQGGGYGRGSYERQSYAGESGGGGERGRERGRERLRSYSGASFDDGIYESGYGGRERESGGWSQQEGREFGGGQDSYRERERYRGGSSRQGGGRGDERGFFQKASDEVMSWFGDDEAARRREQDYRGHGPSGYTRSDERIREDANDRLTDDPRVDARSISVTVENGEVTLNGTVPAREHKRRAEDCVEQISGVRHVQNNLRVAAGAQQGSDKWMQANSESAGGYTNFAGYPAGGGAAGYAAGAGSSGYDAGITGGGVAGSGVTGSGTPTSDSVGSGAGGQGTETTGNTMS